MMDKENIFIGEDGLVYCSVCKEPKQAWLPGNNLLGVRIRYRQCACERDANAMKKAEQEIITDVKGNQKVIKSNQRKTAERLENTGL